MLGFAAGVMRVPVPISTVRWDDWKVAHPDTQVLSRETGYNRTYGRDPYGSYYEDDSIWFPVEHEDKRLHPKTVILGLEISGVYKAYMERDLVAGSEIIDVVNGVSVRIDRDRSGIVSVTNEETNEQIVAKRAFWFAWYAFHPDTLLYTAESG